MKTAFLLFPFLLQALSLCAQPEPLTIVNKHLGTSVSVVLADLSGGNTGCPVIYFTDGQKLIDNGFLTEIERLTAAGEAPPAHYVFVSTVDPASGADLRNDYFFANPDYLAFFTEELLPAAEAKLDYPVTPADRSLVGISFGGLNAAWFAAKDAPFWNYGLLSPITYPHDKLNQDIVFGPSAGQRIFISTGQDDAERYVDELLGLYRNRDFVIKEVRTTGSHDFANWRGQLPALFQFLTPSTTSAVFFQSIPLAEYDRNIAYYASMAPAGADLQDVLTTSRADLIFFFDSLSADKVDYAYGWGKWTVAEVLHHLIAYERIMLESAQMIAGTAPEPLRYQRYTQSGTAKPGKGMGKDELLRQFLAARDETITVMAEFTDEQRRIVGRHEGFRTSVRALALCIVGHQVHHFGVLRERYGVGE